MTEKKTTSKRPFLDIHFKCCSVYTRIYLNRKGTAFVGWCPRCSIRTEIKVSKHGSPSRFFATD